MQFSFSYLMSIVEDIAAGASALIASGVGGTQDRQHITAATNAIGAVVAMHNAQVQAEANVVTKVPATPTPVAVEVQPVANPGPEPTPMP